jgi:UDP-glucose 4-epimerase
MEMVLADTAEATRLRVLSLRYFNPIGADPELRTGLQAARPTHALGKMISAWQGNEEFLITGTDWPTRDGSGIRDYVHVWDLARAHVQALRRFDQILPADGDRSVQVVNLGTGDGTTVRELVAAFAEAVGPLRTRDAPARPGDVAGSFTRSTRSRTLLHWKPEYSVADGIRHSVAWCRVRDEVLGVGPEIPVGRVPVHADQTR